jgi:hypothetical protein
MSNHRGTPTGLPGRLVVATLAVMALSIGSFWMWSTATGVRYAGVPSWLVGLVVVALVFALARAIHHVNEPR